MDGLAPPWTYKTSSMGGNTALKEILKSENRTSTWTGGRNDGQV